MSILSSILSHLSGPTHNSHILSIGTPQVHYLHVVPEPASQDQGQSHSSPVVEHISNFSGSGTPKLPSGIKAVISREALGELPVKITEGETLDDVLGKLKQHVIKAFEASSSGKGSELGAAAASSSEERCARALRQGFSTLTAETTPSSTGAAAAKYPVEILHVSRKKPGPIWDDSELTSFPH